MLLRENGSRHQIYHLLALLHCLERRADRDLCFSEAHVPTDQAVHDLRTLHIALGRLDRCKLVVRLLKLKHFLKLALPDGVRPVGKTFFFLPLGVERHQLLCDVLHRCAHAGARLIPLLRAQLIELRRFCLGACILLDNIRLCRQHVKIAAAAVLDLHVILHDMIYLNFFDTAVDTKSMTFMHHIISDIQIGKAGDLCALIAPLLFAPFLFFSKNIAFRDHRKTDQRILISLVRVSPREQNFSRLDLPVHILREKAVQLVIAQILCKTHGARA